MEIHVLGCHGAELLHRRTCSFLINQTILLDAGTISTALSLSAQQGLRAILISHTHADHIKGLPSLLENLAGRTEQHPITIFGIAEVIDSLKTHLFNDEIWPDHLKIFNAQGPIFKMQVISPGDAFSVEGLEITPILVHHTVPCTGFIIREAGRAFLYSGDTSETTQLWECAAREPALKAAFIEVSFPNALQNLAETTQHLTPNTFVREFKKIGKPELPLYAYHMKPRYLDTLKTELQETDLKNLHILRDNMKVYL